MTHGLDPSGDGFVLYGKNKDDIDKSILNLTDKDAIQLTIMNDILLLLSRIEEQLDGIRLSLKGFEFK